MNNEKDFFFGSDFFNPKAWEEIEKAYQEYLDRKTVIASSSEVATQSPSQPLPLSERGILDAGSTRKVGK